MQEWVARFCEALRAGHYSEQTITSARERLRPLVAWLEARPVRDVRKITSRDLEEYQLWEAAYRKADGSRLDAGTRKTRVASLKGLFRWLTRRGVYADDPASRIEYPRVGRRLPKALLSRADVDRVLAQPDLSAPLGLRDRAMLELLYSTGLRRAELAGLSLADLDLAGGLVVVRRGKGGKDRVVPIGQRAVGWIRRYLVEVRPILAPRAPSDRVFLTRRRSGFSLSTLSLTVAHYIRRSSVGKGGSCHSFRHAMATHMLENGADVRVIQEILGHAELSTTAIYTRVAIPRLQAVHAATHPAERGGRSAVPTPAGEVGSASPDGAPAAAVGPRTAPLPGPGGQDARSNEGEGGDRPVDGLKRDGGSGAPPLYDGPMLRLLGWVLVASMLALLHAGAAVASIRARGGWGAEGTSTVGCGCRRVEHCDERAVGPQGSRGRGEVVFAPNQPDSENRLVSLNASGAGYLYDGDGQLVRRTVVGVATTYLVDDQTPAGYTQIAEERVGGVVAKSYVFGAQRVSMRGPDGVHWYAYDAHSGARALLDAAGMVTDTYEYDAFGTVIARMGTTENAFTYRGEQVDSTLGLQYLRARWMDPAMGRFHTRDAVTGNTSRPSSAHGYCYASDDSVGRLDPSGHFDLPSMLATAAIVSTLATVSLNAIQTAMVAGQIGSPSAHVDALMVSGRVGLQGWSVAGDVGLDVLLMKNGSIHAAISGDLGTSPISVFSTQRGRMWSFGAGLVYGLTSPAEMSGLGFTATWPLSVMHLIPRMVFGVPNYTIGGLMQLAKNAKSGEGWVASLGYSTSGPVYWQVGPKNNTLSYSISYSSDYLPISALALEYGQQTADIARQMVEDAQGSLESTSSDDGQSNLIQRILAKNGSFNY